MRNRWSPSDDRPAAQPQDIESTVDSRNEETNVVPQEEDKNAEESNCMSSKELIIACPNRCKGFVEVSSTHHLSDVRSLILDDFDDDMIPEDGDFFLAVNGIRLSLKQEMRKLAWNLPEESRVSIHSKRKKQKLDEEKEEAVVSGEMQPTSEAPGEAATADDSDDSNDTESDFVQEQALAESPKDSGLPDAQTECASLAKADEVTVIPDPPRHSDESTRHAESAYPRMVAETTANSMLPTDSGSSELPAAKVTPPVSCESTKQAETADPLMVADTPVNSTPPTDSGSSELPAAKVTPPPSCPLESAEYEVDIPVSPYGFLFNIARVKESVVFAGYNRSPDGGKGPAETARCIRNVGDAIVSVDGIQTTSLSFAQVTNLLIASKQKGYAKIRFRKMDWVQILGLSRCGKQESNSVKAKSSA